MKGTRHEMDEHGSLETPEASDGRGAQEYMEFETGAARQHARRKTREVQQQVRHVRHESTFGMRHVRHKARKVKDM